jgi:molybdopterin synthase sulfur carrier subunit
MDKPVATTSRTEVAPRVKVILPGALLRLFPGAEQRIEVRAATVDEMLDALNELWPGMRDRLADTSPAVRRHISIFVDGERAGLNTELQDGTEIFVLTAMSGG